MRDAIIDGIAMFGPDKAIQSVARAEIRTGSAPMLEYPGSKIGRHTDIHRPAIPVSHDIYPATTSIPNGVGAVWFCPTAPSRSDSLPWPATPTASTGTFLTSPSCSNPTWPGVDHRVLTAQRAGPAHERGTGRTGLPASFTVVGRSCETLAVPQYQGKFSRRLRRLTRRNGSRNRFQEDSL